MFVRQFLPAEPSPSFPPLCPQSFPLLAPRDEREGGTVSIDGCQRKTPPSRRVQPSPTTPAASAYQTKQAVFFIQTCRRHRHQPTNPTPKILLTPTRHAHKPHRITHHTPAHHTHTHQNNRLNNPTMPPLIRRITRHMLRHHAHRPPLRHTWPVDGPAI